MEPAGALSLIQFGVSGRVAHIALNAPPLNTLTMSVMREINRALDSVGRMPPGAVYAVVFSASPESTAFSTGIAIEDHRATTAYQTLQEFHNIYRNLRFLGKPVIGIVNGQAFSAGCELVAYCDIVVASTMATFGQPEARLGMFPPMASALLPRIIGARRALRMILLGEALDAYEAQRAGLVDYVVPPEQLAVKAKELVDALGGYSAPVLEAARRALHTSMFQDVEACLEEIEDQYLNQLMSLQDAAEGLEAFRQQRRPVWRHR